MLDKPGLTRAIPMGILGFVIGALLVLAVRALQGMDPLWEPGVALAITPLFTTFFFLWGMGAFNPKMSEHGDHGHHELAVGEDGETAITVVDEHAYVHEEEEVEPEVSLQSNWFSRLMLRIVQAIWNGIPRPSLTKLENPPKFFLFAWIVYLLRFIWGVIVRVFTVLLIIPFVILGAIADGIVWFFSFTNVYAGGIWRVFTWAVIVVVVLFAIALLPTGLRLDTTKGAAASAADIGYDTIQVFGQEVEVSQLTVFVGFIFVLMITLAIVASLLALAFYAANKGITEVRAEEPSEDALTPPEPVRDVGEVAGFFERVFRGIPWFLGYRN